MVHFSENVIQSLFFLSQHKMFKFLFLTEEKIDRYLEKLKTQLLNKIKQEMIYRHTYSIMHQLILRILKR
jgi:hypothetical protein